MAVPFESYAAERKTTWTPEQRAVYAAAAGAFQRERERLEEQKQD
jgi:hypothetical protein